jgi:hypothetical protein
MRNREVVKDGVDAATLKRVKTRMLADWNNKPGKLHQPRRHPGQAADLWGDANVVNKIPGWIEGVTSADIQRAASTYLTDQPHRHRPQACRQGAQRLPQRQPAQRNKERIDEKTDADTGDFAGCSRRLAAFAADAPPWPKPRDAGLRQGQADPAPQIVKKTLANGMTVWVVPRKGLPRVDYVLAVRGAGYAADDKRIPASPTCWPACSTKAPPSATRARSPKRRRAWAARSAPGHLGRHLGAANALASHAGPMMSLLAEVARTPSFPAKEVELAKANALQSLRGAEATPRFRAERAINKAVYGDHPYGHTQPTAEAINSVTEEMLRSRAREALPSGPRAAGDHRPHQAKPRR